MREWFMPFTTKRPALSLTADEQQRLESLRRSRSGEKGETLHAGILLDLASGESDGAAARRNGVNRHTVALCARKFLQFGLEAALGELPRPGKERRIPDDAIALSTLTGRSAFKSARLQPQMQAYGLLNGVPLQQANLKAYVDTFYWTAR